MRQLPVQALVLASRLRRAIAAVVTFLALQLLF